MLSQQELATHWQNMSVLDLWHSQVALHHSETYKGIGLAKFPQDLWSYEKLIVAAKPEVIIEIGINQGGFTRWLYDRLLVAAAGLPNKPYTIIGIDVDITTASFNLTGLSREGTEGVQLKLIQCDLLDPSSLQEARKQICSIINERPTLIIEDSGHTYETTKAALGAFSTLLKPGEWFIVEDTCVDIEELRESPDWPTGALSAVNDFIKEHPDFEQTNFNHAYTVTCHPFGFLRKKATKPEDSIY